MNEPIYTLTYAREQLANWLQALEHASTGGTYSIAGKSLTRQDIPTIRSEIQRWHNSVRALEARAAGKVRPMGAQAAFPPAASGGGIITDEQWSDPAT